MLKPFYGRDTYLPLAAKAFYVYKKMQIEFDWDKSARNFLKHGFALADAARFSWENAVFIEDTRRDYGEKRFWGFGFVDAWPCCVVFTRRGACFRIISLRPASCKERKQHYDNSH